MLWRAPVVQQSGVDLDRHRAAAGYSAVIIREGLLPTYVIRQEALTGAHPLKTDPVQG